MNPQIYNNPETHPSIGLLDSLLCQRVEDHPDRSAYVFLGNKHGPQVITYGRLARERERVAAYLQRHTEPGERIILFFPPGLAYIVAFLGCLCARRVSVPLYPPRPREKSRRIHRVLEDCGAGIALTTGPAYSSIRRNLDKAGISTALKLQAIEDFPDSLALKPQKNNKGFSGKLAFLQYTSGSTGAPKGVMVGHANLMANQEAIAKAFRTSQLDICLNWLPFYHDMGLIGTVLHALYRGCLSVLMPAADFIREPWRWLTAVSQYRATVCGAPNFAYEMILQRTPEKIISRLDLRSWRVAFNGAEPVRAETLRLFSARFRVAGFRSEAFFPCYGLAEATLFVTGSDPLKPPRIHKADRSGSKHPREYVSCGRSDAHHRVVIVDPDAKRVVADGQSGEIWVGGPSIALGYWNQSSAAVFRARLARGAGSFLRTGDLGFLHDGELFITGRMKDLMIIRGRNYHPQDLEMAVEGCHGGLRPGGGAAFLVEVEGLDRLVIVHELARDALKGDMEEIVSRIRQALATDFELTATGVVLVKPGGVPKTSSGKIRRFACRDGFLAHTLPEVWRDFWPQPLKESQLEKASSCLDGTLAELAKWTAGILAVPADRVDPDKPLISLGLDSMAAITYQHGLETRWGATVPLADLLAGMTPRDVADLIENRVGEGSVAVENKPSLPRPPATSPHDLTTLSRNQRGLWFLHQLDPTSPVYNLAYAVRIRSRLDRSKLRSVLEELVGRHACLRNPLGAQSNNPFQAGDFYRETDAREWPRSQLEEFLEAEAYRPFDLRHQPALRAHLLSRARDPILLLVFHHIAVDLWSILLFIEELGHLYQGRKLPKEDPDHGYAGFVAWQERLLQSSQGRRLWSFWRDRLGGHPPTTQLPMDCPRGDANPMAGARYRFHLGPDLSQRLAEWSRELGMTRFAVLLAVYTALLHRLTGQSTIVVGTPASGRTSARWARTIGYFANMLVIKGEFFENEPFSTHLARIRRECLAALRHQDFPFQELVERLHPEREAGLTPLFQTAFVFQQPHTLPGASGFITGEPGARLKLGRLVVESLAIRPRHTPFDLTLNVVDSGGGLSAYFDYRAALFNATTIHRMARYFVRIAEAILDPSQPLTQAIDFMDVAERHLALHEWNCPKREAGPKHCLHKWFERQASAEPAAVAMVYGCEHRTYRALNRKAARLAGLLRKRGLRAERPVGLCFPPGLEMITAMLAVLKAGGCYLPLRSVDPQERLRFILRDAGVSILIHDPTVKALPGCQHRIAGTQHGHQRVLPAGSSSRVYLGQLAYILYTSGSTGQPKGVGVSHGQVTRLFQATKAWFGFGPGDVWTQFHAYVFDFSVWEIWGALLYGGRLVTVSGREARSPRAFSRLVANQRVTIVNQTPTAFRQWVYWLETEGDVGHLNSPRAIVFGGEALDKTSVVRWFRLFGDRYPRLINMYGITETTVHVTYHPLSASALGSGSETWIGKPIPDLAAYVLDGNLGLCPAGVKGELFVGGAGLARGYFKKPTLTARRFVPDPYAENPGTRLYRSGDMARLSAGGVLAYAGRGDHQVKIRGHRIELGEIEARLKRLPGVGDAVVVLRRSQPDESAAPRRINLKGVASLRRLLKEIPAKTDAGEDRLLAYLMVSQQAALSQTEMKQRLRDLLPDYMVPHQFVTVKTLPRTVQGKLDIRALPDPGRGRPDLENEFKAPATPVEKRLAHIWKRVLNLDQVGVHDNFFDLGGDSIRSIQARALAAAEGLQFSIGDLFRAKTVHALSSRVKMVENVENPDKTRSQKEAFSLVSEQDQGCFPDGVVDAYPLARLQAGVIFHGQQSPYSPMYREIFLYLLQARLAPHLLEAALARLTDRHAILRTSFDLIQYREPLQLVWDHVPIHLPVVDLRHLDGRSQEDTVKAWIEAEKTRRFEWSRPPLVHFSVLWLAKERFHFVLSFHDAVSDGWSDTMLLMEILPLYSALLKGEAPPQEPPLRVGFRDFVGLERKTMASKTTRAFWARQLEDCTVSNLPRLAEVGESSEQPRVGFFNVPIEASLSDQIQALARRAGVSAKHVLLAAHMRVLAYVAGQTDVMTGLESNGRLEEPDGERVLGVHLNILPFRLRLGNGSWLDLIRQTFQTEQALLPHRRFPLAELQRERAGRPLFEVNFNYTHFHAFKSLLNLENLRCLDAVCFGQTHFTLSVEFNRDPFSDKHTLDLVFNHAEIGPAQMKALGGYYLRTLRAMATSPEERLGGFCALSRGERQLYLREWNQDATVNPPFETIHAWFEAQAQRSPQTPAVIFEDDELSYQQLDEHANRLARTLRTKGVGFETLVGLAFDRSLEMMVAILGVLKAGGAYLPLEPSYPEERLAFMVQDAGLALILSLERFTKLSNGRAPVMLLDREWSQVVRNDPKPFAYQGSYRNQAYVLYTSGSTGLPKGVPITHGNLVHSNQARSFYRRHPGRFLLLCPFSFDLSAGVIFWTLTHGGTLVIPSEGQQRDVWELKELVVRRRVTHWLSVPSLYKAMLSQFTGSDLANLTTVICAGEACPKDLLELHRRTLPSVSFINEYGPTEATIWACAHDCRADDRAGAIPIGRPILHSRALIMDSQLQPVPAGVVGRVFLGGECLSRGYLNRPVLTARQFIPDPYGDAPGRRLYHTGDVGRFHADGLIEILGRTDFQVKIRGYRIELQEIEACLLEHNSIQAAVVLAREDRQGNPRLVAYVTPTVGSAFNVESLTPYLNSRLADYMVPQAFVTLDSLPQTANGKVDRKALPEPELALEDRERFAGILASIEDLSEAEAEALLAQVVEEEP